MGTDNGASLFRTNSGVLLVQEATKMVTEGHNVPRFHLIKRYWKSKRMDKLILDIKERWPLKIVIHHDPARNPAADEHAMAHTGAVDETAAAEEPEVVHTHAAEQTTIAEETGLRQRKKIVAIHDVNCEKCKRRTEKVVKAVEGVESVSVDMETKKVVVVGKADPMVLTANLRKFGFTELVSVGPANED